MSRIVIPTDFSENALHAIRYGHEIFTGEQVEWVLLNTFGADLYTSAATMGLRADSAVMEEYHEMSRSKLQKLKEQLEEEYGEQGFTYEMVSRYDFLPDAINYLIAEKPVYLVAMGTQGATGAKELFFGSNAVRVMEVVTQVPILAIPESSPVVVPRKIALATTYTDLPVHSQLDVLTAIADRFDAEITMIHISEEVHLSDKQKKFRDRMQENLSKYDPALYTLAHKKVDKAVAEYIESTNTDILALISRKHSFFKSLLKKSVLKDLGYHSKIPLFVMHHQ